MLFGTNPRSRRAMPIFKARSGKSIYPIGHDIADTSLASRAISGGELTRKPGGPGNCKSHSSESVSLRALRGSVVNSQTPEREPRRIAPGNIFAKAHTPAQPCNLFICKDLHHKLANYRFSKRILFVHTLRPRSKKMRRASPEISSPDFRYTSVTRKSSGSVASCETFFLLFHTNAALCG